HQHRHARTIRRCCPPPCQHTNSTRLILGRELYLRRTVEASTHQRDRLIHHRRCNRRIRWRPYWGRRRDPVKLHKRRHTLRRQRELRVATGRRHSHRRLHRRRHHDPRHRVVACPGYRRVSLVDVLIHSRQTTHRQCRRSIHEPGTI